MRLLHLSRSIPDDELDEIGRELGEETARWMMNRIKAHTNKVSALTFEVTTKHDVLTIKAKPIFSLKDSV